MNITRSYLQAEPWDALIYRINEEYGTELQPFSTDLVSIEAIGPTRTKVVITTNQADTVDNTMPPVTRTEYFYDRLDLRSFFRVPGVQSLTGFNLPISTFDLVKRIGELNDIDFSLNDFKHIEYNDYEKTYILEANPDSYRFVGNIQFKFVNTTKRNLSVLGSKVEFPTANTWPMGVTGSGKMAAQYLTAGFDFTSERDLLINQTVGKTWPDGRKLAAMLRDVTKRGWICSNSPAPWNIANDVYQGEGRVKVFYNGRVLPRYSPRTDMLNVLVLELSNLSNNMEGYMLLHYN